MRKRFECPHERDRDPYEVLVGGGQVTAILAGAEDSFLDVVSESEEHDILN